MAKRIGLARTQALIENLKREIQFNKATLAGHRRPFEVVTGDHQLTAADSGGIIGLDAGDETSAVTITLPQWSDDLQGTTYEILVLDPSDGSFLIETFNKADVASGGDIFIGALTLTADQVSSTTNGCNGRTVAAGASISRIVIDANLDDTGGEQGTNLRITGLNPTAQGGGRWYVEGTIVTDDADSDGSAIFVNAS